APCISIATCEKPTLPMAKRPTASGAIPVFVDSGAWIALVSARDQHHSTDTLFRHTIAARNRIVTSNLVLAEVHRLLLHRVGIAAARPSLRARRPAHPLRSRMLPRTITLPP